MLLLLHSIKLIQKIILKEFVIKHNHVFFSNKPAFLMTNRMTGDKVSREIGLIAPQILFEKNFS